MYHIIANPVAGRGHTIQYLPKLVDEFNKRGLSCESHITAKVRDGYEFAKQICETAADCTGIIGIGGDGTIQEIVAGMVDAYNGKKAAPPLPEGSAAGIHSLRNGGEVGSLASNRGRAPFRNDRIPIPLAICPVGSGNDFVMTLEGGKSAAAEKYKKSTTSTFVDTICEQNLHTIDVITANGEAFLNIANIGVDARIVQNAAALKQKHGGRAYLAAVYKSIMRHKNIPMTVEFNGETFAKDYTLVAICNGQYYGGGLRIAPSAQFDDGKITLCMIDGVSRPKLGVLFPSLLIEKHTKLKIVDFTECTEVRVTLPPGTETLCLDGNLYPKEGEIHFKILPNVLDVFL